MARVNGDAALAELRAAGRSLPVILCSGNATDTDAPRYRALGFCDQLGKPFTEGQLRSVVARATGKR